MIEIGMQDEKQEDTERRKHLKQFYKEEDDMQNVDDGRKVMTRR